MFMIVRLLASVGAVRNWSNKKKITRGIKKWSTLRLLGFLNEPIMCPWSLAEPVMGPWLWLGTCVH